MERSQGLGAAELDDFVLILNRAFNCTRVGDNDAFRGEIQAVRNFMILEMTVHTPSFDGLILYMSQNWARFPILTMLDGEVKTKHMVWKILLTLIFMFSVEEVSIVVHRSLKDFLCHPDYKSFRTLIGRDELEKLLCFCNVVRVILALTANDKWSLSKTVTMDVASYIVLGHRMTRGGQPSNFVHSCGVIYNTETGCPKQPRVTPAHMRNSLADENDPITNTPQYKSWLKRGERNSVTPSSATREALRNLS